MANRRALPEHCGVLAAHAQGAADRHPADKALRSGLHVHEGERRLMDPGSGLPVLKDVVLVGAGHAHVGVLRRFGMKPEPGVRFTLITRQVDAPYSGMLPGQVAGLYGFDDTHIDTGPLCRFAGARLIQDEAVGLDLASRRVLCRHRPPVPFDLLSLDIGSTPNTEGSMEPPSMPFR
jgi:hypothetical protein